MKTVKMSIVCTLSPGAIGKLGGGGALCFPLKTRFNNNIFFSQ